MSTAEEIVQIFLQQGKYNDIQEVMGVIFLKNQNGKWTTEGTDLWHPAARIVDSIASASCTEVEKRHATYGIMANVAHRSPTIGRDIIEGLTNVGFRLLPPVRDGVFPSSGSAPIESA